MCRPVRLVWEDGPDFFLRNYRWLCSITKRKIKVVMGFVKHNTDHPIYNIFGIDPSFLPEVEMTNNGLSDLSNDEADGTVY